MYYQGGSETQATDDLQTLYPMNPNNAQQPHANIVFLNSETDSTTVRALHSHAPLTQAQQSTISGSPPPMVIPVQQDEVHAPHEYQAIIPSFDYNLWRTVDHDHPNTSLPTPKCLSLSVSSDQAGLNKSFLNDQDFLVQVESKRGKIMGSKYLKAAQQILDEVANVGEGIHANGSKDEAKIIKTSITSGKHIGGAEPEKPTTAQRQEILMKKAKVIAMLDEVSNWFVNARVRLRKPMVEEMYLEEMKNQQQMNCKLETTAKSIRTNKELGRQKVSTPNQQENSNTTPKVDAFQSKKHNQIANHAFNPSPTEISSSTVGPGFAELIHSINMETNPSQIDPKKPRKENAVTDQDNSPNNNQISETSKGFSSSHAYFSRHGRFSTEQKSKGFHGNSLSLSLLHSLLLQLHTGH